MPYKNYNLMEILNSLNPMAATKTSIKVCGRDFIKYLIVMTVF